MRKIVQLVRCGFVLVSAVLLASCSSGNSANQGVILISPSSIMVTQGTSSTAITVQLSGGSAQNQMVQVQTDDPAVASLNATSCTLSSGDHAVSKCTLYVTGVNTGAFVVTASAAGYASATASGTVIGTSQKVYGNVSVTGAVNNARNITYPVTGSGLVNIQATLVGSQNVTSSDAVYAQVNPVAGLSFPNGQTCQLTSAVSTCSITAQVTTPSTTTLVTTLVPAGAGSSHYPVNQNTTNLSIVGTSAPTPSSALGKILISTVPNAQSVSQFYAQANGPLMATWIGGSGTDSYEVVLTSTSNLLFYEYPATSSTKNTSSTSFTPGGLVQQACTLQQSSNQGCGFNVYAAAAGSATVSCTVNNLTNPGGKVPVCTAQTFNIVSQPTDGRQIVVTNNLVNTSLLVGATSGTVASYTGADNSNAQANSANANHTQQVPSAAGAGCGPNSSNVGQGAQTACPFGSSCRQGGATPGGPFYCYADLPSGVNNGSPLLAPGASRTVTIPSFWGASSNTGQIQWSGNFYFYGDDCLNATDGCQAVSTVGTGPNNAAVTLAEVTFQHNANDYYDVSIINGLNYALSFGPTGVSSTSPYVCGTAGGGTNTNPSSIGVSTWNFTPPSDGGVYVLALNTSQSSPARSVTGFSLSCALTGQSCDFNPTVGGGHAGLTGPFYGYATGDQIYGWNSLTAVPSPNPNNLVANYFTNNAPFYFGMQVPTQSITNGNLFLCSGTGIYTDYSGPTSQSQYLACGGSNWVGITTPSMNVTYSNPQWVSYVLPTIQWLKQGCPSCYTFPFDDKSSTFQCSNSTVNNTQGYTISVSDINGGMGASGSR